jgi:hypothetical protein
MNMVVKQTQEQLYANVKAFYEIIKPAVLWLIPTVGMTPEKTSYARANGVLFDHWLNQNAADANGEVDYSVQNMRKAYIAMRDSGLLKFDVAPKSQDPKPVLSAEVKGLRSHAQPKEEYKPDPSKDVMALAKKAALTEAAEQMFGDCLREIQTYQGRTHGKTATGRAILKGILDKALAGGAQDNPAVAAATLSEIRERIRTLYDE